MCILLFEARTAPAPNEYVLIIANNRDEKYDRPAKVSQFWAPHVVGGRDAFPGKEGGTWIGMSKAGKIGVLLNIWQPLGEEQANATGRGHLVSDYLMSRDEDGATTYLESLTKRASDYNHFRLIAIEIRPPFENPIIGNYTNLEAASPKYLQPGIHAMGNNRPKTQWNKVIYGREKFTAIVAKHRTVDSKELLIDELLDLLNDETRHSRDPQVEIQGKGYSSAMITGVNAIHVKVLEEKYGTRTNTVILVDGQGHVDYVERTMEEPIDPHKPKWIVSRHEFQLNANK